MSIIAPPWLAYGRTIWKKVDSEFVAVATVEPLRLTSDVLKVTSLIENAPDLLLALRLALTYIPRENSTRSIVEEVIERVEGRNDSSVDDRAGVE